MREYYLKHAAGPEWQKAAAELEELEEQRVEFEEEIPTTMVMEEMAKPRETFVLARGDYQNKRREGDAGRAGGAAAAAGGRDGEPAGAGAVAGRRRSIR